MSFTDEKLGVKKITVLIVYTQVTALFFGPHIIVAPQNELWLIPGSALRDYS